MNSSNNNLLNSLYIVWLNTPKSYKLRLILITILSVISGLTEIITLGSVIPFLSVLLDVNSAQSSYIIKIFTNFFSFINIDTSNLIFTVTFFFILFVLLSTILRIILIITYTHWTFFLGVEIAEKIYGKSINQPYEIYSKHNSSNLLSVLSTKLEIFTGEVFGAVPQMFVGIIISISITLSIFIITPFFAIVGFSVFGISYFLIHKFYDKQLSRNSINIASKQSIIIKLIQETLGSIKNIILDKSHKVNEEYFYKYIKSLRKSQFQNSYIAQYPKFLLEGIAIILIALLALYLFEDNQQIKNFIPELSVLALGGQKLLPLYQMIYNAINRLKTNSEALKEVTNYLNQSIYKSSSSTKNFVFNNLIEIKNLSFKYDDNQNYIIKNLNFKAEIGSMIGIYGKSGSGKTTFFDIIMGLLLPCEGEILIDGEKLEKKNMNNWHSIIAHVPQNVFMYDDTIKNNIVNNFDDENINLTKYEKVLIQSDLYKFINNLPEKDKTPVGERGAKLSGGQKQRIGIARSLYKDAKVFFFDEISSSLDIETENKIMSSIKRINSTGSTIFIISHKLSLLDKCDKIFEFKNLNLHQIK